MMYPRIQVYIIGVLSVLWGGVSTALAPPSPSNPSIGVQDLNQAPFSPSSALIAAQHSSQAPPPALLSLFHDFWHWRTSNNPEFATIAGINDNTAGRLDSLSPARIDLDKIQCSEFLKRGLRIPEGQLSFEDKFNLQLLKQDLTNYIDSAMFAKYFHPVTSLEGPQHHLHDLVTSYMTLESYNDFQKLLSRYGEFPRQADEIIGLLKDNLKQGIMPHNVSMEGVLEQFESMQVTVANSRYFTPFLRIPMNLPAQLRQSLRQQAQERITQDILPAFKKIYNFLKSDYLPHTRPDPSISSLPGGIEYYKSLLQFYTSTKLSAQEIHALGLTESRRLQDKLLQISTDAGYPMNSTLQDILLDLEDSTFNHYSNPKEFLYDLKQISTEIKPAVNSIFNEVPNSLINFESVNSNSKGRISWYQSQSMEGSRPARVVLDANNLKQFSKHEATSLSLHYVLPGKHLLSSFLQKSAFIPAFRKVLLQPRWAKVPATFTHSPAFTEGWALYAEYLGKELKLYKMPMQRLRRVLRELHAAVRLVVDTGIHSLGWAPDAAKAFLRENLALPHGEVEREVTQAVTFPGAFTAAKVGEIKLKELRQRAQNALGRAFSVHHYHQQLLKCTGPLQNLQECVAKYITNHIHEEERGVESEGRSQSDERSGGQWVGPNGETPPTSSQWEVVGSKFNIVVSCILNLFILVYCRLRWPFPII